MYTQGQALMEALAVPAMNMIDEFLVQNLANTAWSIAPLRWHHGPLLAAISAKSRAKINEFYVQGCANLAWSFAQLGVLDEPLMDAIA